MNDVGVTAHHQKQFYHLLVRIVTALVTGAETHSGL